MQQYFIDDRQGPLLSGQQFFLSKTDSHHVLNVLRSRVGKDMIIVCDEKKYLGRLISIENSHAKIEVIDQFSDPWTHTELPVEVTIACGLSKNDKLEQIVQKATECGMTNFQPLSLKRDVVKWDQKKSDQKHHRLTKIAESAAEQSKRARIPSIHPLQSLKAWLQGELNFDYKLIAFEETAKMGHHEMLYQTLSQIKKGQKLVMVFGSEGGIDPEELTLLQKHGFIPCSLGPRILRCETAPIYALSAISYETELKRSLYNENE